MVRFKLKGKAGEGIQCITEGDEMKVSIRVNADVDFSSYHVASEAVGQAIIYEKEDTCIMIEDNVLTEQNIPVLCCYPENCSKLPIVFFLHGFGGNRVGDLSRGLMLAQEGFFTVILDARMHGKRRPPDFDNIFQHHTAQFAKYFFRVVKETAEDISKLIDCLKGDERLDTNRVGIAGISMGGFISFTVITMDSRVKAAAPLIGSPDWRLMKKSASFTEFDKEIEDYIQCYEPLTNIHKISHIALLVQNGVDDPLVPIEGTRKFHEKIQKLCSSNQIYYKYIEYPNVGHEVTDEMFSNVISWFKECL